MRILLFSAMFCCLVLSACTGASTSGSPALDTADSRDLATVPGIIEIPTGIPASRVLQLLGPADRTETLPDGRQMWRYTDKRADYVYTSNSGNVHTLIIGGYKAEGQEGGVPLLLTVVLDPAKKVTDFNVAQMNF